MPNPRDSLECPTPETPWRAQPQRLPGVPNSRDNKIQIPKVGMFEVKQPFVFAEILPTSLWVLLGGLEMYRCVGSFEGGVGSFEDGVGGFAGL